MRILGWVIGLVAVGALVLLAVAGVSAAIGVLVTGVAIVSMIALGSLMGGRNTPNKAPYRAPGDAGTPEARSAAPSPPEDDTEAP